MKTTLLVSVIALCAAVTSRAESMLSGFRESYRGTGTLTVGADSLSGPATASFNSSPRAENGRFAISAAFRYGSNILPLPTSLRFRGDRVILSLGRGATAATGRGNVSIRAGAITFSIPTRYLGANALVTGRIKRVDRGLQFVERIQAPDGTQTLTFDLTSKNPPGQKPGGQNYDLPPNAALAGASNFAATVSWDNDAAALAQRLTGARAALRIATIAANAYEKDATPALVRISRSESSGEQSVYFDLTGNPDAQKGSASPADYRLEDRAGNTLGNRLVMPAGVASMDVKVVPVADGFHEVPEMLTITLRADASYQLDGSPTATTTISDATKDEANDNIFLAYLSPVAGVTSSASGISTVHLRGDNTEALVDLTFSGLASAQSAAHINAPTSDTGAGPDIKGLPRGQLVGSSWTIAAAQFFSTDQATLDALYSGQLSISVLTGNYPDGEIRGNYVMNSASADPPIPPDPPADGQLTGEALRRDVARFLMQATFGPTQGEIDALVADIEFRSGDRFASYSTWIDQQFALDQTRLLDYVQAADAQEFAQRGTDSINYASGNEPGPGNRRRAWWTVAVKAKDELRQRVAFSLNEIFVISEYDDEVNTRHYGAANYYDLLGHYADGNYRALLGAISRNPIMGEYLNFLKNQKAVVQAGTGKILVSPDENYAREVMQLFSIGLIQLNADGSVNLGTSGSPTPTYTNADITELARVLTGWSFSKTTGSKDAGYPTLDNATFNVGGGPQYFQAAWLSPMKNFAAYHDTGAKTVLGTTIPAGLTGDQDLDAALDILANHPNTAPFLSRQLIQRLVTSNPSAGYIYRVAKVFNDDGTGQRGNLKAVVKAILLDHEARNAAVALEVGHGKQKEPILRYVQLLRALGGASTLPLSDLSAYGYPAEQLDDFPAGVTRYRYPNTDTQLSQTPQRAPTVFNWFLPDYSPPGILAAAGLVAPEMQLTTETQVIQAINYSRTFTESNTGQSTSPLYNATDATLDDVKIDRSPQVNEYKNLIAAGKTVKEAVTAVVDDLDLLLAGGRLKERYETAATPNPRSIIIDTAVATSEGATSNDRVKLISYLLTNSPTYIHQP